MKTNSIKRTSIAFAMIAMMFFTFTIPAAANETNSKDEATQVQFDSVVSDVQIKADKTVDVTLTKSEKEEVIEEQTVVVDKLSDVNISELSKPDLDELMKNVLEENYDTTTEIISEQIKEQSGGTKGEVYEIDININPETYALSDDASITFDGELVALDIFSESEEKVCDFDAEENNIGIGAKVFDFFIPSVYAASGNKTKTASHTRHIYDSTLTSWAVVTAYINAEFTYNTSNKTVTAIRRGNYMKTNGIAGILANVYNTSSAVQKPSTSRRIAYQSGYASSY
jgi:hypothetical protein